MQIQAILILLGPVLVRCIRRSERQNLTDLSLTDVMADDSESSMGDLCSKGMVFGCQPSTICESDGRYCMLKSEQDLLVGFDEKKSAVVAAAQAYKEDQYLADLWDYVNNLWDVSLYSKAVQESAGELSQLMSTVNASVRDLNTAAIRISDGISAGGRKMVDLRAFFLFVEEAERQAKTFSKEDLFQAVKKMIPGLSSQEVEVGAEKWDAALAQEPLCENPLSFNCSKKLLRKLAPATFQTVAKLYSEIKSQALKLAGSVVVQFAKDWIRCEVEKFVSMVTMLVYGMLWPLMPVKGLCLSCPFVATAGLIFAFLVPLMPCPIMLLTMGPMDNWK